ncbi:hypothetical protein DPMN_194608 [Dreissena polymorpha]|uniref:BPTI/Kunitz inhibitor domain-containing protein n=1 Tax=Dreissena polymorpha TaxID=45954 RepID=A0A9D3Y2T3_DREPO|nr:hypothetical protein DPMN_194608 [Dreissena polymorpha]
MKAANTGDFCTSIYIQCFQIYVPVCNLQQDSGPCFAYIPGWYHVNGGRGNRNNFQTRAKCERECIVCNLPRDSGP